MVLKRRSSTHRGRQDRFKQQDFSFGSVGIGSSSHLMMEQLINVNGLKGTHAPYSGGPLVLRDVLGEHLDAGFVSYSIAKSHIQEGKVVGLGRVGQVPQFLPEVDFKKDVNLAGWVVVTMSKKASEQTRIIISDWLVRELKNDKLFTDKLAISEIQARVSDMTETQKRLKTESDFWQSLTSTLK